MCLYEGIEYSEKFLWGLWPEFFYHGWTNSCKEFVPSTPDFFWTLQELFFSFVDLVYVVDVFCRLPVSYPHSNGTTYMISM